MARITEKGLSTFPSEIRNDFPITFAWFQNLQLQFPKVSTFNPSIDLASIGATTYSKQTFSVPGLTTMDIITVNPPSLTSGLYMLPARVSAADTLELNFYNSTAGAINESASTYLILAVRI